MLGVPLPTAEAIKWALDDLGGRIPKAKDADPRKLFDDSFVRQCSRAASSSPLQIVGVPSNQQRFSILRRFAPTRLPVIRI